MFTRRLIPVGLLGLMAVAAPLHAQTASTKIAVVNTHAIFTQLQEVKDLQVMISNDGRTTSAELDRRKAELENLRSTRDQLKADSQQWIEANRNMLKKQAELQSWVDGIQADHMVDGKLKVKQIFDEIQQQSADIAKQMGVDVVISQQSTDLMSLVDNPQVNVDNFVNVSEARSTVLYASPAVDITDKVIAALDAKYKSSGNAMPTPPAAK